MRLERNRELELAPRAEPVLVERTRWQSLPPVAAIVNTASFSGRLLGDEGARQIQVAARGRARAPAQKPRT
jgi:hypothetical protein